MTFEAALATGGALVAAWDYEDPTRTKVRLCAVSDAGAKVVAENEVSLDKREDVIEQLLARGVRIGGAHATTSFVWAIDEAGYGVWSDKTVLASAAKRPANISAVNVFVDGADRGHRGVRLILGSGEQQLVAEQHDPAAHLDVTYGDDNLASDIGWAKALGEHLAIWLLVPLVDDVTGDSIEPDLEIARVARALAAPTELVTRAAYAERSLIPVGRSATSRATTTSPRQAPTDPGGLRRGRRA